MANGLWIVKLVCQFRPCRPSNPRSAQVLCRQWLEGSLASGRHASHGGGPNRQEVIAVRPWRCHRLLGSGPRGQLRSCAACPDHGARAGVCPVWGLRRRLAWPSLAHPPPPSPALARQSYIKDTLAASMVHIQPWISNFNMINSGNRALCYPDGDILADTRRTGLPRGVGVGLLTASHWRRPSPRHASAPSRNTYR